MMSVQNASRSQVSIEFLLLTGILLLLVFVIGGFSLILFSDSSSNNQIQFTLRALQAAVNHVNALGPGNSVVVSVSVPSTVSQSFVGGLTGTELVFTTATPTGDQNAFVYTDTNVFGSIPSALGSYSIRVSADFNGVVLSTLSG